MEHDTRVKAERDRRGFRVYRAACTCGWATEWTHLMREASERDALAHQGVSA